MGHVIDRETHSCAEEIFTRLGTAINELQLYTQGHPRFRRTAERIAALVSAFFDSNPESKTLTFTLKRKQLEFRNIPLMNVGPPGRGLILTLDGCSCKGLQFVPGISSAEIERLLQTLLVYTRSANGRPSEPPSADDDSKYRFLYSLPENGSYFEADEFELDESEKDGEDAGRGEPRHLLVPQFRASASVFKYVTTSYRAMVANVTEGRTFNIRTLQKATGRIVSLVTDQNLALLPAPDQSYFDDFTIHHSINVSLLATRAAALVITDQEDLNKISAAALLHDIGKSRVPHYILDKPGRLSQEEAERLRLHPLLGAEILLGLPHVDPLSVTVAFGHHLRHHRLSLKDPCRWFKPNWVTELVSVIDTYETLTAVRPYKRGLSSELTFRTMLEMSTMKDLRPLIKLLYESLGPYPVGTLVELTSGERAVVLEMNRENSLQPKVHILTDSNLNPLEEGVDLDLAAVAEGESVARLITRALVRQTPGEDLVDIEPSPEPEEILGSALNDWETLMAREG